MKTVDSNLGDNPPTISAQLLVKSGIFTNSSGTLVMPRNTRGHFSELSEVDHQHALA